ncbi:hypothetical protein IAQ61_006991 [Plenodomus lingam]|uniref:uncharacterized protein n=1 Tax=Leptosphaeria maculans TaxID=5022 RepID=UPI00331C53E1|nr:hypothetical protein IAQ61_006991 [Plenodomus lingam]
MTTAPPSRAAAVERRQSQPAHRALIGHVQHPATRRQHPSFTLHRDPLLASCPARSLGVNGEKAGMELAWLDQHRESERTKKGSKKRV